jgi:hypothetical protein
LIGVASFPIVENISVVSYELHEQASAIERITIRLLWHWKKYLKVNGLPPGVVNGRVWYLSQMKKKDNEKMDLMMMMMGGFQTAGWRKGVTIMAGLFYTAPFLWRIYLGDKPSGSSTRDSLLPSISQYCMRLTRLWDGVAQVYIPEMMVKKIEVSTYRVWLMLSSSSACEIVSSQNQVDYIYVNTKLTLHVSKSSRYIFIR